MRFFFKKKFTGTLVLGLIGLWRGIETPIFFSYLLPLGEKSNRINLLKSDVGIEIVNQKEIEDEFNNAT